MKKTSFFNNFWKLAAGGKRSQTAQRLCKPTTACLANSISKRVALAAIITAVAVFGGCDHPSGGSSSGSRFTGAVTIEGKTVAGQTLAAVIGGPEVSAGTEAQYQYEWRRNETDGTEGWEPIPEAISETYRLTDDDVSRYVKVVVRITGYSGNAESEAKGPIVAAGSEGGDDDEGTGDGDGDDNEGTGGDDDEGAGGGNTLTANVTYSPTGSEAKVAWTQGAGRGTAAETWDLSVTEYPIVYFAVGKKAEQTITVGGTDAALITMANAGETVDGVEASDTLAVFTVKANKLHNGKFMGGVARESDGKTTEDVYDEYYDSQFEGDDFRWTLRVDEENKESKTITVNLRQNIRQEAAVFIVNYDANGNFTGLTRQTVMRYEGIPDRDQSARGHTVSISTTAAGTRLIDMLVEVDRQITETANSGVEYLVRVVKSEAMPCVYLTYNQYIPIPAGGGPDGKIRLRGAGPEALVIQPTDSATVDVYYKSYGASDQRSAAGLGSSKGVSPFICLSKGGALQLEKNITLRGGNTFTRDNLIRLHQGHLIMKNGSLITDHHLTVPTCFTVYLTPAETSNLWPRFTMEGGSITGNTSNQTIYAPLYMLGSKANYGGAFSITGGTISKNTVNGVERSGIVWRVETEFEALEL